MREIKYRGINHETGEWVYGWYTKLVEGMRRFDAIICDFDGELTRFYIHDSKTIGEYTGLKDKNGKEIYEGDILKFDLQDYNGGDHFYVCAVESGGAEFGCKHEDDDYWYWNSLNDITENDDEMEVLGNIHENPELLK